MNPIMSLKNVSLLIILLLISGGVNADPLFAPIIRALWFGSEKCDDQGFKQIGVSLPLTRLSEDNEGDPWRAMYGNCAARKGKLRLQQDWVVSYLDARPQEGYEGGTGYGIGTDLNFIFESSLSRNVDTFIDLGGGYQYAFDVPFPSNGSRSMFTINFGGGFLIKANENFKYRIGIRYMHVSNAALFPKNSGYDGIHLVVGTQW